ncbi:unnamed protein product [Kluyveromyces dobzhanskii CBS 2104]|uniref:WGS project CCBQ000000000 data, contig 00058 n=1 Tax=Kluyveromyces dobzhanskii CBS 2104 TaxID=1427455 RepID=A0A0A8LDW8_9SACH|nr:unnamed protein product [Kluyveromyces dobzhanskii CBS 2104]
MVMNWFTYILIGLSICHLSIANTETYTFHVPADLPNTSSSYEPSLLYIDLYDTTFKTLTTAVDPVGKNFIELVGLQKNENYMFKVCWTAIDPISVSSIYHFFIPHDTEFEGTFSNQTRTIVVIEADNYSYPELQQKVQMDFSLAIIKIGLPVDMYSIILYLACIMIIAAFIAKTVDPFAVFSEKNHLNALEHKKSD